MHTLYRHKYMDTINTLKESSEIQTILLTYNSKSNRRLKIDITPTCKDKQMPSADVFWRLFTRIRDIL